MVEKVKFRRVENGISVSFIDKKTGKRTVAHASSGGPIAAYFASRCTKKHEADIPKD